MHQPCMPVIPLFTNILGYDSSLFINGMAASMTVLYYLRLTTESAVKCPELFFLRKGAVKCSNYYYY